MEKGVGNSLSEIRLNEIYSHLYYSDFEDNNPEKKSEAIIKRKTIFTEDYIKRLHGGSSNQVGVIPPNCRYIEELTKGYIVVIEEPPALRTIKLRMSLAGEVAKLQQDGRLEAYGYKASIAQTLDHRLSLAFPYVIFLLYISEYYSCHIGKVFVRPAQMSGLSDYICTIPLTNISDYQTVCFGDDGGKRQRSLSAAIQHIIMVFWSAQFNTDYTYNYTAYRNTPILNSYLEWQYMSRENPMFIYNADWIKYGGSTNINIGSQIDKIKDELQIRGRTSLGYKDLSDVFYKTQDSGIDIKPSLRSKKTHRLFYDICQGIYLYNNVYVNVGDTVKMHNGDFAHIDSFAGFMSGGDIQYILMDYKGKKFQIKLTSNAMDFLTKNIDAQRKVQEATLKNGVVVKPGDILIMKDGISESFRKIHYIRKSRGENEDIIELKMLNNYYLAHKIEAKLFNIKNPELCGIPLKEDSKYLVVRSTRENKPLSSARIYKFDSIDVDSNQTLLAIFKSGISGSSDYKINLSQSFALPPVINLNEVKKLDNIFRVGRKAFTLERDGTAPKSTSVWAQNGRTLYSGRYNLNVPSIDSLKSLLNKDTFSIQGADFDTTFKVGDKVIVANWLNPLDVLNIKSIAGFKFDETKGNISFILIDKNEKLTEEPYINSTGYIATGKIRKVTNKFENLSVGTKIIAKEAGIAAFPKKDINIIVSIIIDGPYEPLVLCSNGCTLWYSTVMEKFERITMKSKRWKTLQHTSLDLSKIKFQTGDIIAGQKDYLNKYGYILFIPHLTNTLRAIPLNYYSSSYEAYVFDKYFISDAIFDCIPNPRIGPSKQTELGKIKAFYDFHGGTIPNSQGSEYSFINERGDIDVSSTHK